jgi:hypothetical protein
LRASACQNGIAPEAASDCHARPKIPVTGFRKKFVAVVVTTAIARQYWTIKLHDDK